MPIASVDDEIISLQELNESLSAMHESKEEGDNTASKDNSASKMDYKTILDRLINMTLINMEAKDMGLDKLPDVQDDAQEK